MLAEEVDSVVGVDTHRDQHVIAVVVARTGVVVAQRSVPASARGHAEALGLAQVDAAGSRVWAVEGAGHYGVGLARHLSGHGETVFEIGRGPRDERRLRGKDDLLDAIRAARTALASEMLALPRSGQRREALRLLLRELLSTHFEAARAELERYGGREVKTTGDGMLALFDGAARALHGAEAIRRAAIRQGLQIRAGVHVGEVELVGTDVRGITVHEAARIMASAEADEILLSDLTRSLAGSSDLAYEDAGVHALKGLDGDWHLWALGCGH